MTFEISSQLKMIHNVNSKTVILRQDSCIEHLTSGGCSPSQSDDRDCV